MTVNSIYRIWLGMLIPLVMLSSCSWTVDTELTELAVDQFHQSYNEGSFTTIFKNASPAFQDFVTEDKFSRLLEKLHKGLGQHQRSTRISWSAESTMATGTTITLVYEAIYEKDDTARETFTFRVKDGLAKLYNFNVSSKVLAGKKAHKTIDI